MFIKTAIVEDDEIAYQNIKALLERYTKERGVDFEIHYFSDGVHFLQDYKPEYEIVFMDIKMPQMNGLEVAKKMRQVDLRTFLIFVTDLAQYAIKGYEVDAIDFIVKPVKYEHLRQKLDRICSYLDESTNEPKIFLKAETGNVVLNSSEIRYVEIIDHRLFFHMANGETYNTYGSLNDIERQLKGSTFSRCNHCYIVNLKYVTGVDKYTIFLGKDQLSISHPKKKLFMEDFTKYLGDHQ